MAGAGTLSGAGAPADGVAGTVILLHGLNRTQLSMLRLSRALSRSGYHVWNRFYRTRALGIDEHGQALLADLRQRFGPDDGPFHFVGHSLGCLVVRAALRRCAANELPLCRAGRCVMIGPPNHGSELAHRLRGSRLWSRVYGTRAFAELARPELVESLGSPPLPVGIIAGARGDGRGWNPLLPGDDDGIVTLSGTHLPGESDHIALRAVHTVLPWKAETARQVLHFLAFGSFARMPPALAHASDGGSR